MLLCFCLCSFRSFASVRAPRLAHREPCTGFGCKPGRVHYVRRLQEIAFEGCRRGAHIGDAAVGCAIRLAGQHRLTAEPEIGGSRPSKRPVALIGSARHDLVEAPHRAGAVGDAPRSQVETPGLADHRVFGDAESAADFGGGESLVPELAQPCGIILVPAAGRRIVLHGGTPLSGRPLPRRPGGGPRKGADRRPARPLRGVTPAGSPGAISRLLLLYSAAAVLLACGSLVATGASSTVVVASRRRAA